MVAVSSDGAQQLRAFKERLGLDIILLSDTERRVISQYGLVHPGGHRGEDIARPATFIIDRDGVVRWMRVAENFMVRPAPQEVMEALQRL